MPNSSQEKLQFTPFWGGSKPGCSDGLHIGTIESHNFFVLRPILVKFHIRTRLIESFPTIFRTWWCGEEKLHFTPFHTLRQLKRDDVRFHHFGGSQSFERGTGSCLYAGFFLGGRQNLETVPPTVWELEAFLITHTHTRTQGD